MDRRGIYCRHRIRFRRSGTGNKYFAHGDSRLRCASRRTICIWRVPQDGQLGDALQTKRRESVTRATNKSEQHSAEWNANLYDAKHAFVWKFGADLVQLLAPQPGERILDIGCCTGHLSRQIADSGARVLGVDRSSAMVNAARNAYPDLQFEVVDARNLSYQS